MQVPLVFRELFSPSAVRPALRGALIAAAAVAGYVTAVPHFSKSAAIGANAGQPDWAGHIAPPELQAERPSAPVTSASYMAYETAATPGVSPEDGVNRSGTAAAALPAKALAKMVTPPRRALEREDVRLFLPKTDKSTADKQTADRTANRLAAAAPASIAVPEAETKPLSRNLLSPVTDHLPTAGTLLRPLHIVGDTFHNIIKSF